MNVRHVDKAREPAFHIGTSGWHYKDWHKTVYPENIPPPDYLAYYATHFFNTVEINNSFYHLPTIPTARTWYGSTSQEFLFSIKVNRFITHIKKLKDAKEPLSRFLRWTNHFKEKRGPLLFQCPPHWKADPERLEQCLKLLPRNITAVFEFRDPSWYTDDIYRLLRSYNAPLCIYDKEGFVSPQVFTSDIAYVRFHGPQPAYHGRYTLDAMNRWAHRIKSWKNKVETFFIYFNNDHEGNAVRNAIELHEQLAQEK